MSAVDTAKPVEVPVVAPVDAAPAPVPASDNVIAPVEAPKADELPKTEQAVAPVEEKKDVKAEEKVIEPIHTGALGYKAPGLKNAFRYSKKYFWFGEEPVPAANLSEYLRGEKPEVAHSVAAWSSQTGKGLLFFVKHADKKEHPAGVLNLAYATELVKDGTIAFNFKLSGHKHAFEAQNAPERDGWFVAVEKAIADAKEAKEGIESSEGYKEQKEKIGKPVILASASAAAPKKTTDATPKLADPEAPVVAEASAPAARTGSSSSSSSDEEKKAKKSKSKSRSVSRGKRASIFGGLLGGKHKDTKEGEASKTEAEVKKEESAAAAPQIGETSTTAPVITTDIPKPSEELKTDVAPVVAEPAVTASAAAPVEEVKTEETPKVAEEKPKPTKRGSIFGSFVEKLKSPTHEKKEPDFKTPKEDKKEADLAAPVVPTKEPEVAAEASKPLEEAQVAAPVAPEIATEPVVPKTEETKPSITGDKTPSKERELFSFGKFFGGSKERAKSPAAQEKVAEPKVDAVAPKIEDPTVASPVVAEPAQPVEPVVPATESKAEATEVKSETPKKEKRGSVFGALTRSLSKATGKGAKKDSEKLEKEKKDAPATVPETTEETKVDAPAVADKPTEAATTTAPVEKTIGDVPAEAVTVGEPKSAPVVATT